MGGSKPGHKHNWNVDTESQLMKCISIATFELDKRLRGQKSHRQFVRNKFPFCMEWLGERGISYNAFHQRASHAHLEGYESEHPTHPAYKGDVYWWPVAQDLVVCKGVVSKSQFEDLTAIDLFKKSTQQKDEQEEVMQPRKNGGGVDESFKELVRRTVAECMEDGSKQGRGVPRIDEDEVQIMHAVRDAVIIYRKKDGRNKHKTWAGDLKDEKANTKVEVAKQLNLWMPSFPAWVEDVNFDDLPAWCNTPGKLRKRLEKLKNYSGD